LINKLLVCYVSAHLDYFVCLFALAGGVGERSAARKRKSQFGFRSRLKAFLPHITQRSVLSLTV
jgi:hypothetical protein